MENVEISIIIPTYNSSKTIKRCLDAIYLSSFKNFEVIVVDDCSKDNTREIVEKFPCKLITLKKNSGPSVARNIGAKNAKNNILFFVDSDLLLLKNAIEEVLNSYKNNKNLVAMIGMYAKEPANKSFFNYYMALWKYYTWTKPKPPEFVTNFTGSCSTIKRDIFNQLNGFSIKYKGADVEDYEFGYRLTRNHKIKLNTRIQGKHFFPSFKSCVKNYYRRSSQWFELFLKRKKFDTGAATPGRGFVSIVSFFATLILILSIFYYPLMLVALILFIIYFLLNFDFFIFTLKEKGFLFMIKSIATNYLLTLPISFGVIKSFALNLPKLLK